MKKTFRLICLTLATICMVACMSPEEKAEKYAQDFITAVKELHMDEAKDVTAKMNKYASRLSEKDAAKVKRIYYTEITKAGAKGVLSLTGDVMNLAGIPGGFLIDKLLDNDK